jgi:hypothetical protein
VQDSSGIGKSESRSAISCSSSLVSTYLATLLLTPLTGCIPYYSSHECEWFTQEEGKYCKGRWYQLADGQIVIPETLAPIFVKNAHWNIEGKLALEHLLSQHFYVPHLTSLASNIYKQCETCAKNDPKQGPLPKLGAHYEGSSPFEGLEIDFTELPQTRGYKYLLVTVCTFSGWVEAFPTQTEKAQEMVHALLKEIIPRYGIPISIGSDNGPAFVAEVVKQLTKG